MSNLFKRALIGAFFFTAFIASAQPFDWASDAIVFGTSDHETLGRATANANLQFLRAICRKGDSTLCSKLSTDRGESWSLANEYLCAGDVGSLTIVSDAWNHYILVGEAPATKRFFRFSVAQNNWLQAHSQLISDDHTNEVADVSLYSGLQPSTLPRLHALWMERSSNQLSVWHVVSSDTGNTFSAAQSVLSATIDTQSDFGLAMTSCYHGSAERLFAALAIDRTGSIPEAIVIRRSDDQGTSWPNEVIVDNSYDAQRHPSLTAHDSTVMVVYERQANGAQQRDIYFSYSPNAGANFSQPIAVASSSDDEHHPQAAADRDGRFSIFYVKNAAGSDSAGVWMRNGIVTRPWELSDPVLVSDRANAVSSGGLFAGGTAEGPIALWTSRFMGGDLDVSYDAAWRGSGISNRVREFPNEFSWGLCYPNPFNAQTTLRFGLTLPRDVILDIVDLSGRQVERVVLGRLNSGRHEIPLDLRGYSSGSYFVRVNQSKAPPQRITLIK